MAFCYHASVNTLPTRNDFGLDQLTAPEEERTRGFLERYPELEGARRREETWTEEEIVEWAVCNIKVRADLKERVGDLFLKALNTPTCDEHRLPPLVPSTTLAGLPYPLAGPLSSGLLRLAATPSRYKELVDLLNEESAGQHVLPALPPVWPRRPSLLSPSVPRTTSFCHLLRRSPQLPTACAMDSGSKRLPEAIGEMHSGNHNIPSVSRLLR